MPSVSIRFAKGMENRRPNIFTIRVEAVKIAAPFIKLCFFSCAIRSPNAENFICEYNRSYRKY